MAHEAEPPRQSGNFWKRFVIVSTAIIIGGGFLVSAVSFRGNLGTAATFIKNTFGDVLGSGNQGKLAAEIGLALTSESGVSSSPSTEGAAVSSQEQDFGEKGVLAKGNAPVDISAGSAAASPSPPAPNTQGVTSGTAYAQHNAATAVAAPPECGFQNGNAPNHAIVINEIAWMGSPAKSGETASAASNNEWMELKNVSSGTFDLSGAILLNQPEKFKVVFASGEKISAGGFSMLERTDDDSAPGKADAIYAGALSNSGEWLRLFDKNCNLIDEINASAGWQGGNNETKATLERDASGFGWHTSTVAGGTPGHENTVIASAPPPVSPPPLQATPPSPQPTPTPEPFLPSPTPTPEPAPTPSPSPSPEPTSTPSEVQSAHIVISEIFYDAVGSDTGKEFVELYNPSSADIDLKKWSLKNSSSSLTSIGSKAEDKTAMKSGGYFLVGFSNYNGSPSADVMRSASLPNASATIILFDTSGGIVDSVSYDHSVLAGQSYERSSIGSNQFVAQPNPNPQNSGL